MSADSDWGFAWHTCPFIGGSDYIWPTDGSGGWDARTGGWEA